MTDALLRWLGENVTGLTAVIALFMSFWAFRSNAKAADLKNYVSLSDRLDMAWNNYRLSSEQFLSSPESSGVVTSSSVREVEVNLLAERLLAVVEDTCHLYNSGTLPRHTQNMIREYVLDILPLEDEGLVELMRRSFSADHTFAHIRRFGRKENKPEIVRQFSRSNGEEANLLSRSSSDSN